MLLFAWIQRKILAMCFFLLFQLDLVVFSNVAQLVVVEKEVAHPLQEWLSEHGKNLIQHFERIKEKSVSFCCDWIVKKIFSLLKKKMVVYF